MPLLDLNDQARLRHDRDKNLGFPIGSHIQPPPMLFNRDGLNIFQGDHYKGTSAFLILGGPSFGELINGSSTFNGKLTSNRELLNYPGFITMAVNNSVKTFRPNLWTCVDNPQNFIKSIWLDPKIAKYVPFDHTEKKIFDNESWKEMDTLVGECPNTYFYRRNEHFNPAQFLKEGSFNWGEHSDSLDELGNKGGRSVFLVAIKLLYYLGVRNIFLLGCDFKMDENTKYHFEQDRSTGSQKGNNSTYKILEKRFEALLPHFQEVGLNVFNCNPDSGLKVFPMLSFTEAIHLGTLGIPDIKTERTAGLYDRKANEKNKPKTLIINDDMKRESKNKLDKLRKELDNAKHALDTYKIMPDANEDNIKRLEFLVQDARKKFREQERIKNNIWGIKK